MRVGFGVAWGVGGAAVRGWGGVVGGCDAGGGRGSGGGAGVGGEEGGDEGDEGVWGGGGGFGVWLGGVGAGHFCGFLGVGNGWFGGRVVRRLRMVVLVLNADLEGCDCCCRGGLLEVQ